MSTYGRALFTDAKTPERMPWESFAVSYIAQAAAILTLVVYAVTAPTIMNTSARHIELVSPDVTPQPDLKPARMRPTPRMESIRQAAIPEPRLQAPLIQAPAPARVHRMEVAEVAQPQMPALPQVDNKLLNNLPTPQKMRVVATNTFGSSAEPTLHNVPAARVQTGGFGDPNGVPANAQARGRANIAAAGSFDLPSGPGNGNGSGGSTGMRGTVASAGFGSGQAIQTGAAHPQAHVQNTTFTAAPAAPEERHTAARAQGASSPVQIQSKPKPVYTPEARQLKVEGEVLLNVVFTADGRIKILNVVHGLGHGLDEAAVRAAQGVRFSPAMRDGQPVDSNATLHIVFQLS